jgi:hypothetical protein
MSNYSEILMEYEECCRGNPLPLASIGISLFAGMIPEMIKIIRINRGKARRMDWAELKRELRYYGMDKAQAQDVVNAIIIGDLTHATEKEKDEFYTRIYRGLGPDVQRNLPTEQIKHILSKHLRR